MITTTPAPTLILGKIAVLLLSLFIVYQLFSTSPAWTLLDFANLIFHEAGHFVTTFFGQFINILGGSLMQLLIPGIVFINFYRSEQYFSCAFALLWLGESLHNLSIYIGDAQAMALPLLGGDNSIHDWNWLLTTMHLLPYDYILSFVVGGVGIISMIFGIAWMGWIIFSDSY